MYYCMGLQIFSYFITNMYIKGFKSRSSGTNMSVALNLLTWFWYFLIIIWWLIGRFRYKWSESCKDRSQNFCHCHIRRRLGWHQSRQIFFWHDTANRTPLRCLHNFYSIASVRAKEDMARLVPVKPSSGMTMTKILRPVFAWCSSDVQI